MNEDAVRKIVREEIAAWDARHWEAQRAGLINEARELYERTGRKLAGTLYESLYAEMEACAWKEWRRDSL